MKLNNIDEEKLRVNTFTVESVQNSSANDLTYAQKEPSTIAEEFNSDVTFGLDQRQVNALRKKYGENTVAELPIGFKESLKRQAKNLISIFFVLVCLLFFIFRNDWWMIVAAVCIIIKSLINAILENYAKKAFKKTDKATSIRTTVIRNGKRLLTESRKLVPGDVIVIDSDCIIPADARIIESVSLSVLETPLTGEKTSVKKHPQSETYSKRKKYYSNMVYGGTTVTSGNATAIVCATGKNMLINKVSANDPYAALPSYLKTVYNAGKSISAMAIAAEIILILLGMFRPLKFADTFIIALGIGSATLCDAAFSICTAVFAKSINKAIKCGCVFNNMNSISRIASANTIMCGKDIAFPPAEITLKNIFYCFNTEEFSSRSSKEANEIVKFILICSSIRETLIEKKTKKKKTIAKYEGNEFTLALLKSAINAGHTLKEYTKDFLPVETEFDSSGEITRLYGLLEGRSCVILRGSPENVISRCVGFRRSGVNYKMDDKARIRLLDKASEMAQTQIPIAIAMGYTTSDTLHDFNVEKKLIFLGFAGFCSETKLDTATAVYHLRSSGFEIAVKSDDPYYTAYNLAKNTHIVEDESQVCTHLTLVSTDEGLLFADNLKYKLFQGIDDDEWRYILKMRNDCGKKVLAGVSSIDEIPFAHEALGSFAIKKQNSDALLNICDIQINEGGLGIIEEGIKQARLITKRISYILQFMAAGFLTLFFWVFFYGAIFGKIPLEMRDIIMLGFVLNPICALSLAFNPADKKILRDCNEKVSKKVFVKGLAITSVYSVFASLLCIISGKIFAGSELLSVPMSNITYGFSLYFYSLMSGSSRSVFANKFYRNYNYIFSLAATAVIVIAPVYIPFLRDIFGFEFLPPILLCIAAALPFAYFLMIQLVFLFIEKDNSGKHSIKNKL